MDWRIGCCGFGEARATYFGQFGTVEIQRTFYQPPRPETLQRWRQEAPQGFEFTLKAWQVITHPAHSPTYRRMRETLNRPDGAGFFQPTEPVFAAWDRMLSAAEILNAGVVLFQCPASFAPTGAHLDNMRRFFGEAPRHGLSFVWEPRGEAWTDGTIRSLCRELNLVHGGDPLHRPPVHGDFGYFRLHGRSGYHYRYTDADLIEIRDLAGGYDTAYGLFNNVAMLDDAARFRDLVGG